MDAPEPNLIRCECACGAVRFQRRFDFKKRGGRPYRCISCANREVASPHARPWSEAEEAYLRENAHLPDRKIGEALGRSSRSVCSKRHEMRRGDTGFGFRGVPIPCKPKGFSPETMAWAKENPGDREAGLILLMASKRDLRAKGRADVG